MQTFISDSREVGCLSFIITISKKLLSSKKKRRNQHFKGGEALTACFGLLAQRERFTRVLNLLDYFQGNSPFLSGLSQFVSEYSGSVENAFVKRGVEKLMLQYILAQMSFVVLELPVKSLLDFFDELLEFMNYYLTEGCHFEYLQKNEDGYIDESFIDSYFGEKKKVKVERQIQFWISLLEVSLDNSGGNSNNYLQFKEIMRRC